MTTKKALCWLVMLVLPLSIAIPAAGWDNPKANKPPRAKPQRRTAAEGIPPLPLPATPLRRTEKKRQPAPPALVGMVNFSEAVFKNVDGKRIRTSRRRRPLNRNPRSVIGGNASLPARRNNMLHTDIAQIWQRHVPTAGQLQAKTRTLAILRQISNPVGYRIHR